MPVAAPNGVAHPRTKMVKELNASVRSRAVLGTQGPHNFTGHAELLPLPCPQCWGVYQFGPCTFHNRFTNLEKGTIIMICVQKSHDLMHSKLIHRV